MKDASLRQIRIFSITTQTARHATRIKSSQMARRFYRCPDDWEGYEIKDPILPEILDGHIRPFNFGNDYSATSWFYIIMKELANDPAMDWMGDGGKCHEMILRAWVEKRILGLCMEETDNLFELNSNIAKTPLFRGHDKKELLSKYFMSSEYTGRLHYVLPCFLITSDDEDGVDLTIENGQHATIKCGDSINLMWVAPRVRRRGLGALLNALYPHEYVHDPLDEAKEFWDKLGYTEKAMPPRLLPRKKHKPGHVHYQCTEAPWADDESEGNHGA